MPVLKPKPIKTELKNSERLIYEYSIVSVKNYTTTGEEKILTKDIDECEIILNEEKNKDIYIKSMTKTSVKTDKLIDEEYEEIILERGACVQLTYIRNFWYILSSDGLKQD